MGFYKGMYVELRNGVTGYARKISYVEGKAAIEISILTPEDDKGFLITVYMENDESPSKYFTRIGDDRLPPPKIKPAALDPSGTDFSVLWLQNKVNELVEEVNKINEQLAKER